MPRTFRAWFDSIWSRTIDFCLKKGQAPKQTENILWFKVWKKSFDIQCLCMFVCCLWQICAQLNGAGCPDWYGSNPPEFYPVEPGIFWKCGGGKLDPKRCKRWIWKNMEKIDRHICNIIAFRSCQISLHSQVASILGGLTFALTFGISVQLCSNFCRSPLNSFLHNSLFTVHQFQKRIQDASREDSKVLKICSILQM